MSSWDTEDFPEGSKKKGGYGVVARQTYRLPGEPRPLVAESPRVAPPPQQIVQAPGTDMGAILALVGTLMTGMIQMMTAIVTRPAGDGGNVALVEMLRQQTALLQTVLQKPEGPAAPAADPLKQVMDLADFLGGLKESALMAQSKVAAGADATTDLTSLVDAVSKGVDVVKKARGLASDPTKTTEQAAADLAAEAVSAQSPPAN